MDQQESALSALKYISHKRGVIEAVDAIFDMGVLSAEQQINIARILNVRFNLGLSLDAPQKGAA